MVYKRLRAPSPSAGGGTPPPRVRALKRVASGKCRRVGADAFPCQRPVPSCPGPPSMVVRCTGWREGPNPTRSSYMFVTTGQDPPPRPALVVRSGRPAPRRAYPRPWRRLAPRFSVRWPTLCMARRNSQRVNSGREGAAPGGPAMLGEGKPARDAPGHSAWHTDPTSKGVDADAQAAPAAPTQSEAFVVCVCVFYIFGNFFLVSSHDSSAGDGMGW